MLFTKDHPRLKQVIYFAVEKNRFLKRSFPLGFIICIVKFQFFLLTMK